MSCPKHRQQELELQGSEYADDDYLQEANSSPERMTPRCIGGHAPDVYCDNCRPTNNDPYTSPKHPKHHLPSHCGADGCAACGKGMSTGAECPGCEALRQEVDTRFCEELGELASVEKRLRDIMSDAEAPHEPSDWCEPSLEYIGAIPDEPPIVGLHYDGGKPPLSMLPRAGLRAVADVFAFGATKYEKHNWRGGIAWSRLLDSALRHITDFMEGEDFDPESRINHMAHAAWNCLALLEYYETQPEYDDRFIARPEYSGPWYDFMGNEVDRPIGDDLESLSQDELLDIFQALQETRDREHLIDAIRELREEQ